jgi:hypothetical protein
VQSTGERMLVKAADELSAAALGRFLEERGCAVYRLDPLTLEANPLGSLSAARQPSQLADHLKDWLVKHPGMAVLLDVH